jgi:uncharacterized alkaline shock family protein YloU
VVIDVDAGADAVDACPAVVRRSSGRGVEVATYLPGRRVEGIRADEGRIEVYVDVRYGSHLPSVADEIRSAVATRVGTEAVDVVITDVDMEGAT